MELTMESVLKIFEEIVKIPRTSKHEQQISDWLMNWAKENNFEADRDESLNVVIKVPATSGYENKPGYVLQGHMDIVGQKTKESTHDFLKDPIKYEIDGDWMKSVGGTTLGADNGIALAMMLAIATSDAHHPALELLVTVDEETGLTGAQALQPGFIQHKKLLNLDSEDDGVITIGSAGAQDTEIIKKYTVEDAKGQLYKIDLSGGKGGHSGVEIHTKIANANVLVARLLNSFQTLGDIQIVELKGGNVRNGVSMACECVISTEIAEKDLTKMVETFKQEVLQGEYGDVEPNMKLEFAKSEGGNKGISIIDSKEVISTMLVMPHSVLGMSNEVAGLVETSNNFAIVELNEGAFSIKSMLRSSVPSRMIEVNQKIKAVAELINADFVEGLASPPWKPNPDSALLKEVIAVYKDLFNEDPEVEAIHAGLESGVIGAKYDGMDMVSIGPTIKGNHTPSEKLDMVSTEKTLKWVAEILKAGS